MSQKHGILKSFQFAFKGLKWAFEERNFLIHLIIACLTIFLGFFLNINTNEWLIVIVCIALVMAFEILNTAIEKTIDLLHPQQHPKAGQIKDLSAAAVLLISIASVIAGSIIFFPKVLALIKTLGN